MKLASKVTVKAEIEHGGLGRRSRFVATAGPLKAETRWFSNVFNHAAALVHWRKHPEAFVGDTALLRLLPA